MVLLDIWLPDRDGLDVLGDVHALPVEARPEVVIISGHGTIETAVKATKLGAYDFLEKPLSLDRTLIVLKNAVEARRLRRDNQEFKRQFSVQSVLTGESVPVEGAAPADPADGADQRAGADLRRVGNGQGADCAGHSCGEPAAGQRLCRAELRGDSGSAYRGRVVWRTAWGVIRCRRDRAVCWVRSRPIPEKRGTLERADGGTLFLDEVGDMSLKTQAKVLSALDEQLVYAGRRNAADSRGCARDCGDEQTWNRS